MKASELLSELYEMVAVHGGEMLVSVENLETQYLAESIRLVEEHSLPVRLVLTCAPKQNELTGLSDPHGQVGA